MTKRARFPIGLTFTRDVIFEGKNRKLVKEPREHTIIDVYTTTNSKGEVVKIEYVVGHAFMGQTVTELMIDTTLARSLDPAILKQYF